MDNNIQQPVQQNVPPIVPQPERKGGVMKGILIGIAIAVGVAIIGVIAFFVFVKTVVAPGIEKSLNDARTKASGAAVKANLASLRPQAEIIYDGSNSYANVCQEITVVNLITNVKGMAYQGDVACFADTDSYAAGATIQDVDGVKTVCVNSTGALATLPGEARNLIKNADYSCK